MRIVIKKATDVGVSVLSKDEFLDLVCMCIDVSAEIDAVEHLPDVTSFHGKNLGVNYVHNITNKKLDTAGAMVLVVDRHSRYAVISETTKLW